jgi:photosystem II stability/assembly factor-like uncharacterized protein
MIEDRLRRSRIAWVGLLVLLLPGVAPAQPAGSLAPDVYLDDITYTLRAAYLRGVTISPQNPEVAYVGSYDGYVWRTVDGGRTWDESRLIVETFPYFGDAGERTYFGIHRLAGGPSRAFDHFLALRGRRSSEVADEGSGDSGKGGGGTGAAANVNFGIGVPGGAPRLQLLVRKFGKQTSGLNIKQTLALRGTRPTEVRIIVIHPHNPKIIFACTAFGLFRSNDGGLNWVRTFMGTSPAGRMAFHLAVDPKNPRKVLLATGEGLYLSEDGGDNFFKTTAKGVGEGVIDWIVFNPYDTRYVFVGTDSGLLRSPDGGKTWDWIYYTTFPTARVVRSIVIDPHDRKTGYIATHDGMFVTPDLNRGGLESWERLGGLQFTGIETMKIAACPKHKGHLWVLTNMKLPSILSSGLADSGGAFVYESLDGGVTWKILYSGNTTGSMQWFENDPRDPDLLWLVWSRSLARMRRRTTLEVERAVTIPDDPPIGEVLQAAVHYTGTDPGQMLRYRARSRWKALVPRLDLSYRQYRFQDFSLVADGRFPTLPFRYEDGWSLGYREVRVLATWDLADLIFSLDASLFGRIDRVAHELHSQVLFEVHRFYGELRRLRVLMANEPPADRRVRVMYKLRIEELTIYINFITGNYLERWKQGDRPSGHETKVWQPWALDRGRRTQPGAAPRAQRGGRDPRPTEEP